LICAGCLTGGRGRKEKVAIKDRVPQLGEKTTGLAAEHAALDGQRRTKGGKAGKRKGRFSELA